MLACESTGTGCSRLSLNCNAFGRSLQRIHRACCTLLRSLHSVPGRLRIKTDVLRRSSAADAVRAEVIAIAGVSRATVNTVTGSLLVTYDPKCLQPEVVWTRLVKAGVVSGMMPTSDEDCIKQPVDSLLHHVMMNIGAEMLSRAILALLV